MNVQVIVFNLSYNDEEFVEELWQAFFITSDNTF